MKNRIAIEVYNPSGATETSNVHAQRLDSLNGKTICELSNGEWEFNRTFPVIREILKQKFPDIKIVPYTEMPMGMPLIDVDGIGELIKSKNCDAVIIGNAA